MENIQNYVFSELPDDAHRQYIDAQSAFTAWEDAQRSQAEVRGGMYWKRSRQTEYLIRTSPSNAQKSLGPRSPETENIYENFMKRKEFVEARLDELTRTLERHRRMNRALYVGRAPRIVVDVLKRLAKSGVADSFTVVGTHALYAYQTAAGVHFQHADGAATGDIDLPFDTRNRMSIVTHMTNLDASMLAILKKVDVTFEIRSDQRDTAVNSKGFEVIIRRSDVLLDTPKFSTVIVAVTGDMARMNTITPQAFIRFRRWVAEQADRDALRRQRDKVQADLVEALVEEYLPHLT